MNIDRQIIDSLYRRFPRRPATLDERNLRLLADYIVDDNGVSLCDDRLIFTGMESGSPFREIMLEHVHGVIDMHTHIAIVLHSSIIFLDRATLRAHVHLRPVRRGFFARMLDKLKHNH